MGSEIVQKFIGDGAKLIKEIFSLAKSKAPAIVFIDERYAWQNYYTCFPREWHIKITLKYEEMIKEFFNTGENHG